MSNLSPEQFVQQHADFFKWTKQEEHRITEEHAVTLPSGVKHTRYPPEAGRKMSQLRGARTFLEDTYSEAAHEAIHDKKPFDKSWVNGPLHEMVDERYHPVVDEFLRKSQS